MTGRLVLRWGRSFSGKSTVAASLAESLTGQVVSLDQINEERGLHGGEGVPLSEWDRTNDLARDRVIARLRQRLMDNRVTGQRGDVADEVTAAHQESFEPPDEDEQALRVGADSSMIDLTGLSTAVRSILEQ